MKLNRYHIDVYVPEWGRESILAFSSLLYDKKLEYSYHAIQKLKRMKRKYRDAIKNLAKEINIVDDIYLDYVFEFYTNQKKNTKKVCYRFPMVGLDSDIIIVISSKAKIVTVYTNDTFDKHKDLDVTLYEKGELIDENEVIIESG